MKIEDYEKPVNMPEISVDEDGIIHVDYGLIPMTAAHDVYAAQEYRALSGMEKSLILHTGLMGEDITGELVDIGESPLVYEYIKAYAVVMDSSLGREIAHVHMAYQHNPFPTKLFDSREEAKEWLMSFL